MIFVDSIVLTYLVAPDHPHKVDARILIERIVADGERLVTDVEALQEIVHGVGALEQRDAIQPTFDALRLVVDDVFSNHDHDVERAKAIILCRP